MLQIPCRIDVLPAFALPIISTRNRMSGIGRRDYRLPIGETALFGIRQQLSWLPMEATVYGKARGVTIIDLIPYRDGSYDRGGSPSLFMVRISGKSTS